MKHEKYQTPSKAAAATTSGAAGGLAALTAAIRDSGAAASPSSKGGTSLNKTEGVSKCSDAAEEGDGTTSPPGSPSKSKTSPDGTTGGTASSTSSSIGAASSSSSGGSGPTTGGTSTSSTVPQTWSSIVASPRAINPSGPTGPLDALRKHLVALGWVENRDPKSQFYDFKFALSRRDLGIRPSVLASARSNIPSDSCLNFFGCTGGLTTKNGIARNLTAFIPGGEDERIKLGISSSFDLSEMKATIAFVDFFQRQHCRSLLFKYMIGRLPPDSELQLKIALNVVTNPRAYVNGGISKEYWKILTTQFPPPNSLQSQNPNFMPELTQYLKSPEFQWTGLDGEDNIWILKPTNANRGRGIRVIKDLNDILRYARCPPLGCLGNTNGLLASHATALDNIFSPLRTIGSETRSDGFSSDKWLIQKYIERPMIIRNRKFDIRQWVVVTSFSPQVRAWFFQDAYLRFASHPYSVTHIDDKFAHLTNNAIVKNTPDANFNVDETMWHSDRFALWLVEGYNKPSKPVVDIVEHGGATATSIGGAASSTATESGAADGGSSSPSSSLGAADSGGGAPKPRGAGKISWVNIQKQMKKLVWLSLQSCRDRVVERTNSFELFGYDFMVDQL